MSGTTVGLNVEMDNKVSHDPFSTTRKEIVGGTDLVPSRDLGHQIGPSDLIEEELVAGVHENDGRRSDVEISGAGLDFLEAQAGGEDDLLNPRQESDQLHRQEDSSYDDLLLFELDGILLEDSFLCFERGVIALDGSESSFEVSQVAVELHRSLLDRERVVG